MESRSFLQLELQSMLHVKTDIIAALTHLVLPAHLYPHTEAFSAPASDRTPLPRGITDYRHSLFYPPILGGHYGKLGNKRGLDMLARLD
jgi:hypothetical protein